MNVWVVGCNGMLGSEVTTELQRRGVAFSASDRETDITNAKVVEKYLVETGPFDWIVNCAAWTAVDDAETNEEGATSLNVDAPAILARAAEAKGTALLHISTDYVFDGRKGRPYLPEDPMAPLGAYGRTKSKGEKAVRQETRRHIILRTAWLYGENGANFVHTMLTLMQQGKEISVVSDQRGSPTWARNLAGAIARVLQTSQTRWGTYHYTDAGEASWYDFALEISRIATDVGLLDTAATVHPLPSHAYPTPTPRPTYSVLSHESLTKQFGIVPPSWQSSLEQFLKQKTIQSYIADN